jgi:predicted RNA polymerase sigma factor
VQAAIAAVHDEAATAELTDWPQILALYGVLERISPNPVVALNRVVATAMVHGPEAGLTALDAVAADSRLKDHHRVTVVRAHLLETAGRSAEAADLFRKASRATASLPERHHLAIRAARLSEPGPAGTA